MISVRNNTDDDHDQLRKCIENALLFSICLHLRFKKGTSEYILRISEFE